MRRKLVGHGYARATNFSQCERVFVLSTGRVGTQSMAALLGLAKTYVAYHEPHPILYGLSRAIYEVDIVSSNRTISCEAFTLSRRRLLEGAMRSGRGYIETSPQVTFLAQIIDEVLPGTKFIHLIRNPYDLVRSAARRKWYSGVEGDETRIVPRAGSEFAHRWSEMSSFEKNVWLWQETNEWIGNFLSEVPDDRKLFLRHEDVFLPDGDGLQRLFDFINTKLPRQAAIQKILSRRLNAQESGEFPAVSEWTTEMKKSVSDIAGDATRRFGYEILV